MAVILVSSTIMLSDNLLLPNCIGMPPKTAQPTILAQSSSQTSLMWYDFNHSAATRYFVKRVLSWWMNTYGIVDFVLTFQRVTKIIPRQYSRVGHYDQSRMCFAGLCGPYLVDRSEACHIKHLQTMMKNGIILKRRGAEEPGWCFSKASTGFGGE
jgi:hypothetical protein